MTNLEIITQEMLLHNLDPMTVTVNTYAGWKRKGFLVKRGEKAVFTTSIWKPSKRKKTAEGEEVDLADEGQRSMYLVKAAFFTKNQVERLEEMDKNYTGEVLA